MNDLTITTLGEITNNFNNIRVPLSAQQRSKLSKIYRYYGAQGIIDYVDDFLFDGEYILVAEDGENLKSQKNKICNFVTGKFWVNNHAHIINVKNGYNLKYLYYRLNLIKFGNYVTGSAQPKLTKDNLNSIILHIHKETDQKKIAAVLSSIDDKIELNSRINAELEAMAKTLYNYWFVQFDFPNENGEPYKSSGGKMVYSTTLKREIPQGWKDLNILAVGDLLGGGTPTKKRPEYWSGNIPFFTPSDADGNIFSLTTNDYITEEGLKKSSTKLFDQNTVFITARGSVGKLVLTGTKMAMNQSCYALRAKNHISYTYLYFLSRELIHHLKVKSTGSVFNSIVSNDIEFTNLAIPDLTLIKKFAAIVEPKFKLIFNNTRETHYLKQLRDWLLPMLMNGQIAVD